MMASSGITITMICLVFFGFIFYRFPNHFILNTEACSGWTGPPSERGVHLGQWSRGSDYAHSIIEVDIGIGLGLG